MSEAVKNVFINYIFCAVFGGILEYIAPPKTRKTLRICVVSLMLVTSLSPMLSTDLSLDYESYAGEAQQREQYDALMHTANLIEKKVYGEMKDILINSGVDEYEIYITTNIDEESNTVYLEKIRIETDKLFEKKISVIEKQIPEEYKKVFEIGVKNE